MCGLKRESAWQSAGRRRRGFGAGSRAAVVLGVIAASMPLFGAVDADKCWNKFKARLKDCKESSPPLQQKACVAVAIQMLCDCMEWSEEECEKVRRAAATDLTLDGVIDAADVSRLLVSWGVDGGGDIDDDGETGEADLVIVFERFGMSIEDVFELMQEESRALPDSDDAIVFDDD